MITTQCCKASSPESTFLLSSNGNQNQEKRRSETDRQTESQREREKQLQKKVNSQTFCIHINICRRGRVNIKTTRTHTHTRSHSNEIYSSTKHISSLCAFFFKNKQSCTRQLILCTYLQMNITTVFKYVQYVLWNRHYSMSF